MNNKKNLKIKKITFSATRFSLLTTLLLLMSCHQANTSHTQVLLGEKLLWEHPDSALTILQSIKHPEVLSEQDYALWCLTIEHARYKLSLTTSPDSIQKIAITYFDKTNNYHYAAEAYYVQGASYAELGQTDKAMTSLKKAEQLFIKSPPVADKQWGLLYNIMGSVLEQEELFQVANDYYTRSNLFFAKSHNPFYQACAYRDMARMRNRLQMDSAHYYFDKAQKYALQLPDSTLYWQIRASEVCVDSALTTPQNMITNLRQVCLVQKYYRYAFQIAYAFLELNQPDSCRHYIKLLEKDTGDLTFSKIRYHYIKGLYLHAYGTPKEAFFNLQTAYDLRESEMKKHATARTYTIAKRYDLAQQKEYAMQLQHESDRKTIVIIWVCLLFILVAAIGTVIIIVGSNHNTIQRKQLAHDRDKQITLLRDKIQCTQQLNLDNNLGKYSLDELPINIRNAIELMTYSDHNRGELLTALEELYPHFFEKLRSYQQLTDIDKIVICLLGLKFTTSDITQLLWINANTFYRRCNFIKQRTNLSTTSSVTKWCIEVMSPYIT